MNTVVLRVQVTGLGQPRVSLPSHGDDQRAGQAFKIHAPARTALFGFLVHPRFFENVLRRSQIEAANFYRVPPPRFAINSRVEWLCQLLQLPCTSEELALLWCNEALNCLPDRV
jgi:hypothetical protein